MSSNKNVEFSPDPRRWASFVVLLAGAFLPPLDFFIVNVALPSIRTSLGTTSAEVQLVISGYAAAYAVFLITGGRLGDIYGRRRIFLAGLACFGVSSMICGLSTSPAMLIGGRILQGLSAAAMAPQGLASINALFPEHERSRALGLYGATIGLAAVVAQSVGGSLISADLFHLHWRVIFLINLPVVAAVLIGGLPLLSNTRSEHPAKLDRVGVVLCALTLGLLVVPLVEGREAGWPWWACMMLILSPVFAFAFWRYESALEERGGTPLVSPTLSRSPGLVVGLIGVLFFYVVAAFFLTFSIYLQGALGASALSAGLVFVPCGIGFFIGPLTTPWAIRHFGRFVPALGMMIVVIGSLTLCGTVASAHAGGSPAALPLMCALGMIGFGQGWALPTLVRTVINQSPPGGAGMSAGVVNSALQISAALGVAVIGGIFYQQAGSTPSPESLSHAFIVAMLCIVGCMTISALLSILASTPRVPVAAEVDQMPVSR